MCVTFFRDHQYDIFNELIVSSQLPNVAVISSVLLRKDAESRAQAIRGGGEGFQKCAQSLSFCPPEVTCFLVSA